MASNHSGERQVQIEGPLDFTIRLHLGWHPTLTYEALVEALTECLQNHGWHRKGLMEIETLSIPMSDLNIFVLDPEAVEKAEPDQELPPNHPGRPKSEQLSV